ncbi:MAG TPA: GNAT family N-acetyltransferase [Candidatus Limnocylindrales bacterium]
MGVAVHEKPAIRRSASRDAPVLAELSGELGYPAEPGEIERRLAALPPDDDVWVATIEGVVVGWIHCSLRRTLVVEPHIEILGNVVGERWQGRGVGRALMAQAERSADERGVSVVRLRSGSHRDGAHAFYRAVGYREQKTQRVFVREIDR